MSPPECPVAEGAARWPDAPALAWPGDTMSYAALNTEVTRLAGVLARQGVAEGNRVALWMETTPTLIALLFALPRLGAVAVPLSLRAPQAQIPALLEAVAAGAIIADGSVPEATVPRLSLEARTEAVPPRALPDAQPVTAVFTSGSSGPPKAVLHSAGNHRASALGANPALGLRAGDRWLLSLPLFHVGGLGVLWRCFLTGACVVLPEPGAALGDSLARGRITHLSVVPTQLRRLLADGVPPGLLRAVIIGGDAAPPGLLAAAGGADWPVHASYGCTEAAAVVTLGERATRASVPSGSGRVLPGRAVRIGPNDEIELRGAVMALGYLRGGTLSPLTDAEGWFASGDLGRLEEDGVLHVTGRRDRQFISGGENLHPERIEAALSDLPGVLQAAVVVVPDAHYGHRPVAFIRTADTEHNLTVHVRDALAQAGSLPRIAWPDLVLAWPPERGPATMKPDRRQLTALALNHTQ